jgi:sugar-specific transcriptional regulator TrmB
MEQITALSNIGLTEAEIKVYMAALEAGPILHKALAEKAGIKRPTLYDLLPGLIEKGLISETVKGKRKFLVGEDIQPFLENKKTQLNKAEELIPELRLLLTTATSKPKLLLYEGVEGIKKVWYDHLLQKQPILEIVGTNDIHPDLQIYIKQYYILERSKRRIPLKMLISGPTVAGLLKTKTDKYEFREVKIIDNELFPVPLGLDIYGDNVSIALHRADSEPIGLIIRSKEIATTMRSLFNLAWNGAKQE